MKLHYGDPEEAGMSARRVRHVAQLAERWVEQGITPTLVVLAARHGIIVLHEAFGRLTPDDDSSPLSRDAVFPLASISKPITATAAMILVEDGLLGLNRPVAEYVPEFTGEGKQAAMVHHLLTHTSGLRDEDVDAHAETKKVSVTIPLADATQHPLVHEYLFLRYDAPLWKASGVEMSYANFNYELLGEIVRRVSGQNLADFAHERIFEPLGMTDTYYIVPNVVRPRIVRRPADAPEHEWLDSNETLETPWAASGVLSTALDTAIFGQMFLNGGSYGDARVLSPATVAEMTRNQIPGISARFLDEFFPEAGWSYGWAIDCNKKARVYGSLYPPAAFGHPGSGGVFLWIDPVHDLVGIYFSVVPRNRPDEDRAEWCADLFTNAVTAAIVQ
jgi:CubicO group peptidase (beta-lactamase class C family)